MTTRIPNKQLYSRWDLLPDILKEAIASETNSDIAWKAGEIEHLPKEKIAIVSRLTGYVLMGFIHPEDIAKEIQDALGINPNIAASIANTLNSRLFNPLKNDLEKIYAPAVSESNPPAVSEAERPKIVEEIKKPSPSIPTAPVNAPIKTVSEMDSTRSINSEQAGSPQVKPQAAQRPGGTGVPPGPKIISTDNSTAPSQSPDTRHQTLATPAPLKPPAPPSKQSTAISQQLGTPGPVILHQESEFAPVKSASGFKLEIPVPKFNETKSELGIPPKPAQIEIGPVMEMKQKPPVPPKPEISATPLVVSRVEPRVVHYSESRTPLAPAPPSQGSRVMSQESRMPAPPKPPAPFDLAPSTPLRTSQGKPVPTIIEIRPSPPKSPEKMIQKDYLPDPLKELELTEPENKSNIKN